ncbi:MAG: DUF4339 domain-containing protein [Candidatus Competibacteraceae bacterium]|nr:DUF4339 domain-containing protein [Candidatus Competibacteraceae bacterium]
MNRRQAGPFALEDLRRQAQSGQLTRTTLVWTQGMANWPQAGDAPELQALFASLPPPLPNARSGKRTGIGLSTASNGF